MSLTEKQALPEKPKEAPSKWESRPLFAMKAFSSAISKIFIDPIDMILGFCIFIIGLRELFGGHVSVYFFVLTILFTGISFFDKHYSIKNVEKNGNSNSSN